MMTTNDSEATPVRSNAHDALSVFLGKWRAEGMSFGGTDQMGADPKANGVPWVSTHTTHWHTGDFFLIQDERARIGGKVFDSLSVMSVEPSDKGYIARTFENHGFHRHDDLSVTGRIWVLAGETERAGALTFGIQEESDPSGLLRTPAEGVLAETERFELSIQFPV